MRRHRVWAAAASRNLAAARVLPRPEDETAGRVRRQRSTSRTRTRVPIRRRPLLQRHRAALPEGRRSCSGERGRRPAPVRGRAASIRSARSSASGPHGSAWSACSTRTPTRRLQPRRRRLRGDSLHRRTSACSALQRRPNRPRPDDDARFMIAGHARAKAVTAAGCDRRRRARHAQPARAQARSGERLRPRDAGRVPASCGIRISQATFFALVVISPIALMVGGIGVMAIMSITVTERNARNRQTHPERPRRAAGRDSVPVPDGKRRF